MLDSLDTVLAFSVIMLVVSMLITIAVQMLAAALNLRGINLARGLTHTFNTILPGFEDEAKGFASRILSGRLLSDSGARRLFWKRRATAARPDEIFDALYRIATGRRDLPELQANARRLLVGLGVNEQFLNDAQARVTAATGAVQVAASTVQQLHNTAMEALAQLPEPQRTTIQAAITNVTTQLSTHEAAAAQQAERTAEIVSDAVKKACKQFQYWFDVSQERAQQWFTSHTRWLTMGFAVIFAFWLQLDTVEIFKLVSSNRAVRDSLVAQAGIVTKQAEKILVDSPTVLQQAFEAWRNALQDANAKKAVEGEGAAPAPADTRGSWRQKVKTTLEAAGVQEIDSLLADLDKTIDKTAQENLEASAKQFSEVKLDLDKTGFALFPPDGKGRWGKLWSDGFWQHWWGMVFSAALLSLGAPFWFNVLKSMASLRSKVAENISTEKKGEKAPPGADPPRAETSVPPTVVP